VMIVVLLTVLVFNYLPSKILTEDKKPVEHIVEPGETLWQIAREYQPEVDPRKAIYEIKEENELETAEIYPGQVLVVEATAYTHVAEDGKADINGTGDGLTTPQTNYLKVDRGIISVDPDKIPFYTVLYVHGYGYGVAADVGPSIKKNRIDVFFNDRQDALNFGRREVEVKVVSVPEVRE